MSFDQDYHSLHVFADALLRKSEKFICLIFLNCSQHCCWNIEIFCKFCHFCTIFAIEQNNHVKLFPKWDTAFLFNNLCKCSTNAIYQGRGNTRSTTSLGLITQPFDACITEISICSHCGGHCCCSVSLVTQQWMRSSHENSFAVM